MAMEVDVAIVGGGMGGLALAVGLQERGIHAHVFEKSPTKRKHFGTGMAVGQNGIRALEGIKPGLGEKMESAGQVTGQFTTVIRAEGQAEKRIAPSPQLSESERMFTITWKSALDTLVDALVDPNAVHYRHKFIDYTVVEEGVELRVEVQADEQNGGDGIVEMKVVKAKLLVGADGVWSRVRKLLVGDEPRDLDMITWLSVLPTDSLRSLDLHDQNEVRFVFYPSKNVGSITCCCGSGYSMWQYRVTDKSKELANSLLPDLHAHGREARKTRVLKQIESMPAELQDLKTAMERSESSLIREDRNFDRLPLKSWSDLSGRVVLLGDAAHGMYPGPGMGARVAFEDADRLTLFLHEAFSSPTPQAALPGAVKRFEKICIPRCTKLQAFAAELTTWLSMIPESVQKLSPEEKFKRTRELFRWINRYPAAMAGDPDSTYWKPEQQSVV